jgi:hypothetical protein
MGSEEYFSSEFYTNVGGAMSQAHDLAALCGERSLAEFENVLPHFRLFTALVATRVRVALARAISGHPWAG